MNLLNNYFRPKATFLPLVFGIAVMLLTNTLWLEFAINPRSGVIALSFVFALVVFSDRSIAFILSLVYFVLMAILIFLVAVGSNQTIQAFYFVNHSKSVMVPFVGETVVNPKKERDPRYRGFFKNW